MKKMFIILGVILFLTGCGKYSDKNLIKDVSKKVNNLKSYHLMGTLDIYRNEEKYSYDVDSSYKIYDYSNVLSEEDEKAIKNYIDNFISKTNMDMVFVTINIFYKSSYVF